MADFNISYSRTIQYEGGYDNDPDDFGGETIYGISRKYNPTWKGWELIDATKKTDSGWTPAKLESDPLIKAYVKEFYEAVYWHPVLGDDIPSQEIADELYDCGVNLGTGRAVSFLQTALNLLNRNQELYPDLVVDGDIGPTTLGAIKKYLSKDYDTLLVKVMAIQRGYHYITFMSQSPKQEKFARGWFNRVTL
jgi:lysozyme family protein